MDILYKDTANLMDILNSANPSQVENYLQEQFKEGEPTFFKYIDELLEKKGLLRQDVLIKADLPQKYGYKLLTGESHTTNRDKILRICFAMNMSLTETQRALKLYGMNELYPKIKRDVLLIIALGQKIYDIDRINEMLTKEGEKSLSDTQGK